jgi:hypothetical protein
MKAGEEDLDLDEALIHLPLPFTNVADEYTLYAGVFSGAHEADTTDAGFIFDPRMALKTPLEAAEALMTDPLVATVPDSKLRMDFLGAGFRSQSIATNDVTFQQFYDHERFRNLARRVRRSLKRGRSLADDDDGSAAFDESRVSAVSAAATHSDYHRRAEVSSLVGCAITLLLRGWPPSSHVEDAAAAEATEAIASVASADGEGSPVVSSSEDGSEA